MKNNLDLSSGLKLIWKKNVYEIIDKNDLYINLKKIDDNSTYRISQEEFNREYLNNLIIPFSSTTESFSLDLNSLDIKKQKYIIRILHYLNFFIKIYDGNTKDIPKILNKVALDIGDKNPPSMATLYNWKKKFFINNKFDFRYAIAGQVRSSRLEDSVEDLIKNCINQYYLNEQKISIRELHRIVNNEIWKINTLTNKHIKSPSYETVRKFVNFMDKKKIVQKREGYLEAYKQYKIYKQGLSATRILEYVEIDHVFLDIEVNYREILLGRPVLTMLIDNYSLSILGLYIGFGKPNTFAVLQAIKSSLLPKDSVQKIVDQTASDWCQYGIIENLITDNAKEFHSNDFKNVCLELGINIQYAPPYHAWYKRYVENYFGSLNKKLISKLPGSYADSSQQKKTLPYETFIKILYTYIVEIYHNSYNKRKKGTPYELWSRSLNHNPQNIVFSYDEINIIIGSTIERNISKSGISIDNVYYNDENLNIIRRNLNDTKIKIKRNLDDISYIYVFSVFTKKYIKIYAVDQEYTKGKTVFQHRCILKLINKESKDTDTLDKIYSAEKKITDYLDDFISNKDNKNSKKIKRKDKVLNYSNLSSSTFSNKKVDKKDNINTIISNPSTIEEAPNSEDNEDWGIFKMD
ncbi:DDE-type integrase/transposase/recombinase [Acinetobacter sp. RF15A]|uniref:Mu transposase C-terminal domain-containing protein n=1 Tax=unclassified Acinetobacter TaxID=196816 RepID=UPI001195F7E8|nr:MULTISPECIES: Mu transposase C-terminal domain-containing protein [unclassified Acinetobacter]TSH74834.1 DDE-type integrase/transposase/recombinase [Acinetobacter sp. RF15A]TSI20469.1 DDE-type integrase/transposase/recombinase [Acinetobacter sp. RF15B]